MTALAALLALVAFLAWRHRPRRPQQGPTLLERRARAGIDWWASS